MAIQHAAPAVRWFDELAIADVPTVGGKNASLGELLRELKSAGVRVPNGFATTAQAYREFVDANGIEPEMREHIEKILDLQRAVQLINLAIYESLERAAEYIGAYVVEKFGGRAVCIFQPDETSNLRLAASFGVSKKYRTHFKES